MSRHNFKIIDYSVHLGERVPVKVPLKGAKAAGITVTAVITCRGVDGEKIKINFYRSSEDAVLTLNSTFTKNADGKPFGTIWERVHNYPHFLDLLRNESPIWGFIEDKNGDVEVRLYTGRWEPVGVGDEDFGKAP